MLSGYNLTKTQRHKAWRLVMVLGLIAVAVGLFFVFSEARKAPAADAPGWEATVSARLLLFRVAVLVPAVLGLVLAAKGLFGMIDQSSLGARLFHWAPAETESDLGRAAKTTNAGLAYAAILLGLFIILAGALR